MTENSPLQIEPNPAEAEMVDSHRDLANWLSDEQNEGRIAHTRLKASERVIARVTDGIYRQPASALRELISNAWDADANNVTVLTDAPRFSQIYVRDDGAGMSHETLSRMLHHIGGSAKRNEQGQKLGITDLHSADLTPGGRPIIGKIGIGLFSVSQLSRKFRIITKQKGETYRLVAEVRLRVYSEDGVDDVHRDDDDSFVAGDVFISRESTSDIHGHGTDIILDDVKPRVRDLLRSADRWRALEEKERLSSREEHDAALEIKVEVPVYHTGWIQGSVHGQQDTPDILSRRAELPWNKGDAASSKMEKLVAAIEDHVGSRSQRPDLSTVLDSYLEMLWVLGLSVPVGYVEKHPFELTSSAGVRVYWIANESRGRATEISLADNQTVREAVRKQVPGNPSLTDGLDAPAGGFRVEIDGIELRRPIRFRPLGVERRSMTPMLFVGKNLWDLSSIDSSLRGGDLSLEGYLFWNGYVVPKENNGILIRIRGTSGALFDPTFFKYQVSEQTRLRQITSELFIQKGLDAALNIDRESFNFAHPHVQLVTLWSHRAIRQLTNMHKEVSKKLLERRRAGEAAVFKKAVVQHSQDVWTARKGGETAPDIEITSTRDETKVIRSGGGIALPVTIIPVDTKQSRASEKEQIEAKAEALARVLAAFGVLEDRTYEEQDALISAILQIFLKSYNDA